MSILKKSAKVLLGIAFIIMFFAPTEKEKSQLYAFKTYNQECFFVKKGFENCKDYTGFSWDEIIEINTCYLLVEKKILFVKPIHEVSDRCLEFY